MRWFRGVTSLAALAGIDRRQSSDSAAYVDHATGLTFASYTIEAGVTFRVAVPSPAPNGTYDAVVQIVAPIKMGWAGLAWGGSMTYNPLTVAWANGTHNAVVSSREAFGYYVPAAYPAATYTVFKKSSFVNATHWQVTAKCTGCTGWGDESTGVTTLDPTAQAILAYAYSSVAPDKPADNSSSFGIHDSIGHPIFDFSQGANPNFNAVVAKQLHPHGFGIF